MLGLKVCDWFCHYCLKVISIVSGIHSGKDMFFFKKKKISSKESDSLKDIVTRFMVFFFTV